MAVAANTCVNRRIVVHTPEPRSGAARYVFELLKGLTATGASVALFCPSNFEYLNKQEMSGIEVLPAGVRGFEPAGLAARILRNLGFVFQALWRQSRMVRRGDVVHFQFPIYFPFGLSFFLLAALKNCPIVFTAHDPLPHSWLWPKRFRTFERKMLEWGYRLSTRVIVHNEAGRDTLVREFGLDPGKVAVIGHGPFFSTGCSAELPAFDELRLLAFGSIRQNKGVHLAIQAVQLLNARPGIRVRLTIAGTVANAGEESYWSECKTLIAKSPECIHVIDHYVSESAIGPLLGSHHALLLPYLDFSSESGVAALALSNRRPLIATRVGGLGSLLARSKCGIVIETPTIESVADAIRKAHVGGRDMLERFGTEGQMFVSSERSWRQISTETSALYRKLLEADPSAFYSHQTPAANIHFGGRNGQ